MIMTEETDLIITEQNKSTEEILKAVAKIKSDYHELCNLKDMRITELEQKIEKIKKYGKLLQDICTVMGNDPYMVWRGLEQRVLILWDKSEKDKGLEMAENILDRLLEIKPQEWAEIEK